MPNKLTLYEAAPAPAVQRVRGDYLMNICGQEEILRRDVENGYFFYRFRCDICKGNLLITSGCGSASGFDLVKAGYDSTKKIPQAAYDKVCEAVEAAGKTEA